MVLRREDILQLCLGRTPLVEPLRDPDLQIQPGGIDLTLESVWRHLGPGEFLAGAASAALPEKEQLAFPVTGALELRPGPYLVRFAETVNLPPWLMALARPRSSLLRAGAALHTAVWDPGYRGRSEALLVVYNPHGLRLDRSSRICQLVFFRLTGETQGYGGRYQGENLAAGRDP